MAVINKNSLWVYGCPKRPGCHPAERRPVDMQPMSDEHLKGPWAIATASATRQPGKATGLTADVATQLERLAQRVQARCSSGSTGRRACSSAEDLPADDRIKPQGRDDRPQQRAGAGRN